MNDSVMKYNDMVNFRKSEYKKLFDLTNELVRHCEEHNISKTAICNGVAWNHEAVEQQTVHELFRRIDSIHAKYEVVGRLISVYESDPVLNPLLRGAK